MSEIIISILVLIGAFFTLVGSVGLVKLPDFFTRLHGPTKSTTLGVGAILIASSIYFFTKQGTLSLHEVLITLFLFITAPVSAHLMSKAAIHLQDKKAD
ncbi:MAG: Na+/H+ antiporter subunit G [Campylobacterota bacterium]